uniref:Peptidoglycan recognition protein 6 n=1 Tax=Myripristis murdjan TaxID=586833 RepID=A0A668A9P5_9TELE
MAHQWTWTLALLVVWVSTCIEASSLWHMNDFIKAVEQLEDGNPQLAPLAVLRSLRGAAGLNDAFIQHFLGNASSGGLEMDASLSDYMGKIFVQSGHPLKLSSLGTPTLLSLPLSFMYIHHTSTPSQPCLTFEQCAADMRSMQRFHQEDRGWDDIGYSFVAGSDGYIYEGRGWHWQGAHTYGHNSRGYGVAFIGDYSSRLPSQHSMGLVRDQLASCAVGGGRLVGNFTLQGHRQVVNTLCPGDAFYKEIQVHSYLISFSLQEVKE